MLNPKAQIITMIRDSTLYGISPEPLSLAYVAVCTIIVLIVGYFVFDRLEPRLAEVI
jgi:ABC-type polysaccharide/polyol phosphate export permease